MSTVTEIIQAVRQLSEEDKGVFLDQLAGVDFDEAWDRRMREDAVSGKLDFLWEEAKQDIAAGRVQPLDEILRNP